MEIPGVDFRRHLTVARATQGKGIEPRKKTSRVTNQFAVVRSD
ncbi:hypothetical protein SAMN05444422_104217 [Halobiforma haloterrestris]|uniref:Uncharacterized protein n=1 Tax=Natronobacterium haloterrestre TaxID=148448 RepID=A0A1I1GBP7_NATHA|nr:hypothetical protein SAMN05444422_104217 [Halobiforma haloterrestris]